MARTPTDQDTKFEIRAFYNRLQVIIDERGIKWADLARMIGISPKTLSSMKSQQINPSIITVKHMAKALDICIDELFDDDRKTKELYELYWSIPRYITNKEIQSMTCKQMLAITYATSPLVGQNVVHRDDACKEEIKKRVEEVKLES